MSLNFSIANVVYVKNLSADATEFDVRQKFEGCDEILGINFKYFPGKNQRYCQIEFKSSEGITKASRLNGDLLLNVPMAVTVIEPVLQNQNINQIKSNKENEIKPINENNKSASTSPNTVKNLLNAQSTANDKVGLSTADKQNIESGAQTNASTKNSRLDEFSRFVYLENIPENFNASHIDVLFKDVGKVVNKKIRFDEKKKAHIAYVEFEKEEEAKNALNLNGLRVGGNEILIKGTFSLMNGVDIMKQNFPSFNNDATILNYKPTVSEKVEKVLALKEKLTAKLCAMYKPNLVLINNLIGTPANTLLSPATAIDAPSNLSTNNALLNASALVNAIAKVKEIREKEDSDNKINSSNNSHLLTTNAKTNMDSGNEKKKNSDQHVTKDKTKKNSHKEKHSKNKHTSSERYTSDNYSDINSNDSDTYRSKKYKEKSGRKEKHRRSQRKSSKRKSNKRHSEEYDRSSISSSSSSTSTSSSVSSDSNDSRFRSISNSSGRKSSISNSHSSARSSSSDSRSRSRSSVSSYSSSSTDNRNSRTKHISRRRHSMERTKRKTGSGNKRPRSYISDNSSSDYSSYSYSSRVSYRSRRRTSKSSESKSETPWWVRESKKMEMRQRMKEKRLRTSNIRGSHFGGGSKYRRR